MKREYIDFNDESIPLGKRKQAFVRWAIHKGTEPIEAKRIANKKFGFERKGELVILVMDFGRMHQNSFRLSEVYDEYRFEARHYEHVSIGYDFRNYADVGKVREWAKKHSNSETTYVVCPLYG